MSWPSFPVMSLPYLFYSLLEPCEHDARNVLVSLSVQVFLLLSRLRVITT